MERRGADQVTVYQRPDGTEVVTVTDETGRLIRRTRRSPDGQEVVIIDNGWDTGPHGWRRRSSTCRRPGCASEERYIVDSEDADRNDLRDADGAAGGSHAAALLAGPVRYSPDLRARMPQRRRRHRHLRDGRGRSIPARPRACASSPTRSSAPSTAIRGRCSWSRAIPTRSERRRQFVAVRPARPVGRGAADPQFGVPPENLTSQGYGEQYLKVQTDGPLRENRRVTIRRITPLLNGPQTSQQ